MRALIERWGQPSGWKWPVDEQALDRLESILDVKIPVDYRQVVLDHGIPRLSPDIADRLRLAGRDWCLVELFHPDLIVELAAELRVRHDLPVDLIPIGRVMDDDIICLGGFIDGYDEGEKLVMAYELKTGNLWDVCDSFADYLEGLSLLVAGAIN